MRVSLGDFIVTAQESHIPLEAEVEMKTGHYYIPLH